MKLTKEQVLSIPGLLTHKTSKQVARELGVSPYAIFYWIRKLRDKGIPVQARPRGRTALL